MAALRVDNKLLRDRDAGFERILLEVEERLATAEQVYDCLRRFHTLGTILHQRMSGIEMSYTNFRLSVEHHRDNPIVVEDDSEDEERGRSPSPLMVRVEREDTVVPQGDGPWMIEIDD